MRTLIIIGLGFLALFALVYAVRALARDRPGIIRLALMLFIPAWGLAALYNLWLGLSSGYSLAEELPIFALIFSPPAIAALLIRANITPKS
ncbi:hypothetical protein [Parahaliea mediterranea]|uniref:hypothetical protein n=1 Tax=Parahaliea mediterranea TaxID=651086 RepID=UPI00130082FA|nr:hypothetical protein [Parahaliea mediterranea]